MGFTWTQVYVRAGTGGDGASKFKFGTGRQHRKASGGSGGDGGSIYMVCDNSLNTLAGLRGNKTFSAERGVAGDEGFRNGRNGEHVIIPVPPGTIIFDETNQQTIAELRRPGSRVLVARGGQGGRGNAASKVGRGQRGKVGQLTMDFC